MRGSVCMEQVIRKWRMEDKYALAALLNDRAVLDNLRDIGVQCIKPYCCDTICWINDLVIICIS